jgi:hypothetical protein
MSSGTAQGKPVIEIVVDQDTPEIRSRLPRSLNGLPVVIELGEIPLHGHPEVRAWAADRSPASWLSGLYFRAAPPAPIVSRTYAKTGR